MTQMAYGPLNPSFESALRSYAKACIGYGRIEHRGSPDDTQQAADIVNDARKLVLSIYEYERVKLTHP